MKMKWNGRYTAYCVILILLAILAVWVWYTPGYLKELKRFEPVTEGLDDASAAMTEILEALDRKDQKRLYEMMLIRDGTEYQKMFGPLVNDSKLLPLELKATGKLAHSHRSDNISFYYRSEKKGQNYQFVMLKNGMGEYKVSEIGSWRKLPEGI